MTKAKLLILLCTGMFAFFGLSFLYSPYLWAPALGISFNSPAGVADIRATYGGFELGYVAFLLYCIKGNKHVPLALLSLALIIWGFALGRTVGLIVDKPEEVWVPAFIVIEFILGATCFLTWKKLETS